MLYHLRVKNLALIDSAEVEFGDGLNILTGETGAGKSIIIGSVQIALGGKAPKEMIRRGCDSAYIELVFSIDDERKREQLKEHDVYPDEEGILIISKKITPTRSISRINDETVTAARLREITGRCVWRGETSPIQTEYGSCLSLVYAVKTEMCRICIRSGDETAGDGFLPV